MGFPDDILAEDEQVVESLHPHVLTVLGPALGAVLLGGLAVVAAWATPDDRTGTLVQTIAIGVVVIAAMPLVLVPFLRWRTTHYVITTRRVLVRKGILAKAGKDITLSKITDVSFHQSLLDRIVRSGTLTVETAGDSADELLRNIPHSDRMQQLINRLVYEDSAWRAGRPVPTRDPGHPPSTPGRPPLAEE